MRFVVARRREAEETRTAVAAGEGGAQGGGGLWVRGEGRPLLPMNAAPTPTAARLLYASGRGGGGRKWGGAPAACPGPLAIDPVAGCRWAVVVEACPSLWVDGTPPGTPAVVH